jgi:hypothetical protein
VREFLNPFDHIGYFNDLATPLVHIDLVKGVKGDHPHTRASL